MARGWEMVLTWAGDPSYHRSWPTRPGPVVQLQPVYPHQRGEAPWEEPSGTWLQHANPATEPECWRLKVKAPLKAGCTRQPVKEGCVRKRAQQKAIKEATGCAWAGRRQSWPWSGHQRGVCPSSLPCDKRSRRSVRYNTEELLARSNTATMSSITPQHHFTYFSNSMQVMRELKLLFLVLGGDKFTWIEESLFLYKAYSDNKIKPVIYQNCPHSQPSYLFWCNTSGYLPPSALKTWKGRLCLSRLRLPASWWRSKTDKMCWHLQSGAWASLGVEFTATGGLATRDIIN